MDAVGAAARVDFAVNVPWWVIGRAHSAGRAVAAAGGLVAGVAGGSAVVEDR